MFANISTIFLNWMEDLEVCTDRRQVPNEAGSQVSPLMTGVLFVMRMMMMFGIISIDVISTLMVEGHTNYEVHVPGNTRKKQSILSSDRENAQRHIVKS